MKQTKKILYESAFRQIRSDEFNEATDFPPLSQWKQQRVAAIASEINTPCTFSPRQTYHFTNSWQEKRRAKLYNDERHAIDTSTETLDFLNLIIYNKNEIETNGISMPGLLAIGHHLREKGDRIDYVKLDILISKLFMRRTTSLIASLLIDVLGFEPSEIPFQYRMQADTTNTLMMQYMQKTHISTQNIFSQSKTLLLSSPLTVLTLWKRKISTLFTSIEE